MNQFFLNFIQAERRLHLKDTVKEMFQISSLIYGGVSVSALFALLFETWPELDRESIVLLSCFGLALSILFYSVRSTAPLWLSIVHIPLGVILVNWVVYLGNADQAASLSIIFVLSSAYLFHYIRKIYALLFLAMSMVLFAYVMFLLDIEGWPSIVAFLTMCCLLMGLIVRLITHRMHQLTINDPLTGINNRQTIDSLTRNLIDQGSLVNNSYAFLMIDLNKFKIINDTKGHIEGDKILIQFAHLLKQTVGRNSFVARWGGDEFIVLLKINVKDDVSLFETQLRNSTDQLIGFELGSSFFQEDDTLDSLMSRADNKMYSNKFNRRITD